MLGEATLHYAHVRFKEVKVLALLICGVYLNHSLNMVPVAVLKFQIHEEIEGENMVAADGSSADSCRWLQAISVLKDAIMLNLCLPDTYHTLGLVYDTIGNAEKAAGFYELAVEINARDSTLWKQLHVCSV
ncbi:hypothetical protein Dsin_014186 [Dipteronia sinensis]|uniref:Uncharacterized protein n=1 Tax=Dipteronia sinensis TaxID=43782 RepID=A0AAE0ALG5_9ROSI|nr:hypothetical protein Dsin_014186 [Dipteronia sinensis]